MVAAPGITARRIRFGALVCIAVYAAVGVRLAVVSLMAKPVADVRVLSNDGYLRADLEDRNGELLARDTRVYDVYAVPARFANPKLSQKERKTHIAEEMPNVANKLAPLVGADPKKLLERFRTARNSVLVARQVSPETRARIERDGIRGIQFANASIRRYPSGQLAVQVVGISDSGGHGLSGLERGLDARLHQGAGESGVRTSIDLRVQFILSGEVAAVMEKTGAKAAGGLVMDVNTGEVVAMVSEPGYDPNDRGQFKPELNKNIMAQNVYELGSVFKIMTFAQGIEDKTFRLDETFKIGKCYTVGEKCFIHEAEHLPPVLSARDVLARSSNIGTTQIALRSTGARQRQFLARMGLFAPIKTELYETARPIVPSDWGLVREATVSYGHGISVSPLAYAAAAAAVVNGGRKIVPTFLKHTTDARGEQLISPQTSATMRQLLRYVVTDGSGRNANIAGYDVGGKTGSAMKIEGGKYTPGKLVTSFVAAFPISSPRYLVFVVLDEASANQGLASLAGNTAAPLAGRVIERIAPILGVQRQPGPYIDAAKSASSREIGEGGKL